MNRTQLRVMAFSNVAWNALWQWHQEVMAGVASRGHKVTYVESIGIRRPSVRTLKVDVPKAMNRAFHVFRTGTTRAGHRRGLPPGLTIVAPPALPYPGWRLADRLNAWALRSWLARLGLLDRVDVSGPGSVHAAQKPHNPAPLVIWMFYPSWAVLEVALSLRPSLIVYHCLIPINEYPGAQPDIEEAEKALAVRADLVFANAMHLVSRMRRWNSNTVKILPGVDAAKFIEAASASACRARSEQWRPMIGYFGGFGYIFDKDLVGHLARSRPDFDFTLVGPPPWPKELAEYPNVCLQGPVEHHDLPDLAAHFDVCLLPYRLDAGHATWPTKFLEYLATGRPVVASALPDLLPFRDVVQLYSGAEDALAALDRAVEEGSEQAAERQAIASSCSWDARVDEMLEFVFSTLQRRRRLERCIGAMLPRDERDRLV